jgi:ABC-2 type transport system ATP-binding protein
MASHFLAGVEEVCDRVAILDRGRLVLEGKWPDVAATSPHIRLQVDEWESALPVLDQVGASVIEREIVALPSHLEIADLVSALVQGGVRVRAITPLQPALADVYRRATTPGASA